MKKLAKAVSLMAVPAFLASVELAQARQEQTSVGTSTTTTTETGTGTASGTTKVSAQKKAKGQAGTQQTTTTTKVTETYIDILDDPNYAQKEKAITGTRNDFLARAEKSLEMLEGKIKVLEDDISDGPSSSKDKSGENRAEYLVQKKEAIDKRILDLKREPTEVWSWEKEMEIRNAIRELRAEYQQTASAHTGEKYIDQDRPDQIQAEATAGPSTVEPQDPIVLDSVPDKKVKVETTTSTSTNKTQQSK